MANNSTTGSGAWVSWELSGATTSAAIDARALYVQNAAGHDVRAGCCSLNAITAGSNTVRMLYRVNANTGTFRWRRLTVMAL